MPRVEWNADRYVEAYELARSGLSDTQIAKAIGCSKPTFLDWKKKHPALRRALAKARSNGGSGALLSFKDYVYKRLPEHLQDLWTDINECADSPSGVRRLEALLSNAGMRARQHLFLHALFTKNFNKSEACRTVNIPVKAVDQWIADDPEFSELLDSIQEIKGDFFEAALINKVRKGNTAAILFANRSFNRKRGYGDKVEVAVEKNVNHNIQITSIKELGLSKEARRELIERLRERRKAIPVQSSPIED